MSTYSLQLELTDFERDLGFNSNRHRAVFVTVTKKDFVPYFDMFDDINSKNFVFSFIETFFSYKVVLEKDVI